MKLPIYNQHGGQTGQEIELPGKIFDAKKIKPEAVHFVATAMLANVRSPVAATKTRGEVRGGGKKPWQQKGTGRARAGSIRSPLWRGGGITFGPRPNRNFHKKINRKIRRLGLLSVLSDRAAGQRVLVLDSLAVTSAKTKEMKEILTGLAASMKARKILIILPAKAAALEKTARNLPGVRVTAARNLNVLELLHADMIIILKDALHVMEKVYGGTS